MMRLRLGASGGDGRHQHRDRGLTHRAHGEKKKTERKIPHFPEKKKKRKKKKRKKKRKKKGGSGVLPPRKKRRDGNGGSVVPAPSK